MKILIFYKFALCVAITSDIHPLNIIIIINFPAFTNTFYYHNFDINCYYYNYYYYC